MNQFDKQRIADAIFILENYKEEINKILKSEFWTDWDITVWNAFDDIKHHIGDTHSVFGG